MQEENWDFQRLLYPLHFTQHSVRRSQNRLIVICSHALEAELQIVVRLPRLLKSDSDIARQLAVILRGRNLIISVDVLCK
jgi:hypothetical protein